MMMCSWGSKQMYLYVWIPRGRDSQPIIYNLSHLKRCMFCSLGCTVCEARGESGVVFGIGSRSLVGCHSMLPDSINKNHSHRSIVRHHHQEREHPPLPHSPAPPTTTTFNNPIVKCRLLCYIKYSLRGKWKRRSWKREEVDSVFVD